MRPSNRLTELSIKQSKPRDKQYKITDGEGMFLRIYPNGSKYWQLQYWYEGKQKIISLGIWPEVSLKQAREKRYEAKKKLKVDWEMIDGTNDEYLINTISMCCPFDENEKQALLEALSLEKRAEVLSSLIQMSLNNNNAGSRYVS